MSIRFHYLRSRPNYCYKTRSLHKGAPVACVAVLVDRVNKEISYEVSSLNTKQDSFDRLRAQEIAEGRLTVHPKKINIEVPHSAHEITQIVMEELFNSYSMSDTVRKSAKLWLDDAEFLRRQQNQKSK